MQTPNDRPLTTCYRLLNRKEVAELINCTERTVDRMSAANQLPFTLIPSGTGGKLKRRYILGAIVEWMERNSVPSRQNVGDN